MATRSKPKARKANPEPETPLINVQLPAELPPGVEFVYDRKLREWTWCTTSRKGIHSFLKLVWAGAIR